MAQTIKQCSEEQCGKKVLAKGLCSLHYQRKRHDILNAWKKERSPKPATPHDSSNWQMPVIPGSKLPYPNFYDRNALMGDDRAKAKFMVNGISQVLTETPHHSKRLELLRRKEKYEQMIGMNDEQLQAYKLFLANPVNDLTEAERLYCIRVLPANIVKKLFPQGS